MCPLPRPWLLHTQQLGRAPRPMNIANQDRPQNTNVHLNITLNITHQYLNIANQDRPQNINVHLNISHEYSNIANQDRSYLETLLMDTEISP